MHFPFSEICALSDSPFDRLPQLTNLSRQHSLVPPGLHDGIFKIDPIRLGPRHLHLPSGRRRFRCLLNPREIGQRVLQLVQRLFLFELRRSQLRFQRLLLQFNLLDCDGEIMDRMLVFTSFCCVFLFQMFFKMFEFLPLFRCIRIVFLPLCLKLTKRSPQTH